MELIVSYKIQESKGRYLSEDKLASIQEVLSARSGSEEIDILMGCITIESQGKQISIYEDLYQLISRLCFFECDTIPTGGKSTIIFPNTNNKITIQGYEGKEEALLTFFDGSTQLYLFKILMKKLIECGKRFIATMKTIDSHRELLLTDLETELKWAENSFKYAFTSWEEFEE